MAKLSSSVAELDQSLTSGQEQCFCYIPMQYKQVQLYDNNAVNVSHEKDVDVADILYIMIML